MTHSTPKSGDYSANPPALPCLRVEIPAEVAGQRLDQALAQLIPDYSRNRLQAWIRADRVLVNGKSMLDVKHKVWGGDRIEVQPERDPISSAFQPEDIPLDIIYEDDALLVVNKPSGLVVHPANGHWEGTLLNALLHHAPMTQEVPRAGIVHRLDKDTTGLLVVAKTVPVQTQLVRQLQRRSVKRVYRALVYGLVKGDGTVNEPIARHPRERTQMAVVSGGKEAITHYRVLERFRYHTLVECRLETGRTHQIRVHLTHLGHPLVGDQVYRGRSRQTTPELHQACQALGRQALHAFRLGLIHPVTQTPMSWKAPLPQDFEDLLTILRADGADVLPHQDESWEDAWDEISDIEDDDDYDDDDDVEVIWAR